MTAVVQEAAMTGKDPDAARVLETRAEDPEDPMYVASRLDAIIERPEIYKALVNERGMAPAEAAERLRAWTEKHNRRVTVRSAFILAVLVGAAIVSRQGFGHSLSWLEIGIGGAAALIALTVARIWP